MTNIILCGGSGTRLWPLSRKLLPKQFYKFLEAGSLYQETIRRNASLCRKTLIVTNQEQYFLAKDQSDEITNISPDYLLEPVGRNTAPAIALACLSADSDEIVFVTPSDHLISDTVAYAKVIEQAKSFAQEGYLVTFGIKPTFAETGFGYIEAQGNNVLSFKEKPDFQTAQSYIDSGNFYWNGGMFAFKAGVFLSELQLYAPKIYDACVKAHQSRHVDESAMRIKEADMLSIPDDSIDYAVMEKSTRVKVIPCDMGWSDMGSFDALYDELPKDEDNNVIQGDTISLKSKGNLILSDGRLVATIGIEDLIIIDTPDALLISHKGMSQEVKQVVSALQERGSELHNIHLTAHRPWGTYTILEDALGYKIKRIVVKSGKRLSLQKHLHRNEHWIVLSGTATVTVGENTYLVHPNESTYIKAGEIHRLENLGKVPLTIIEVQVGEYTGEDDIVRLEDDFNREGNK